MEQQQNSFLLPFAVIIAGALIGGALYFSNKGNAPVNPNETGTADLSNFEPVQPTEHIIGNPQAQIKLVEYSDPQCKFCKSFHPTMKRIMSEYGDSGKVAWVYRHFVVLGAQSKTQAEATECATEIGGNEKFWQYLDLLFESKTEGGAFLPGKTIESVAEEVGLDKEKFNSCVQSGRHAETIEKMTKGAIAIGGTGTPFTIIINGKDVVMPVVGAQPYEAVKTIIENALNPQEL